MLERCLGSAGRNKPDTISLLANKVFQGLDTISGLLRSWGVRYAVRVAIFVDFHRHAGTQALGATYDDSIIGLHVTDNLNEAARAQTGYDVDLLGRHVVFDAEYRSALTTQDQCVSRHGHHLSGWRSRHREANTLADGPQARINIQADFEHM